MEFIKPNKLIKGDKVAIISPSWGGASVFPHIYENGIKFIRNALELDPVEFPTAKMSPDRLKQNPQLRAKDINDAFADKSIKGVIATIGGDDSVRILQYLNKEIITKNPKVFLGYSDTTTINVLLNTWGLVTFNGPSIMAGFSQGNKFPKEWLEAIRTLLLSDSSQLVLPKFGTYTNGYPDWSDKNNTGLIKKPTTSPEYKVLQGKGVYTGRLFGGCVDVLEFIKGTQFWPAADFWSDKILFFETSEDVPLPENVKYMLRNYGVQGIFQKVRGVLFGRCRDYTKKMNQELEETAIEVIESEFNAKDTLVVTNLDFGHTDPQVILPLGINVQFDTNIKELKLLESATL